VQARETTKISDLDAEAGYGKDKTQENRQKSLNPEAHSLDLEKTQKGE
jgi:hypothetical protein